MSSDPLVSIVVTIVDGGDALHDFLTAVENMENPPPLEVLVPYDPTVQYVQDFAADFPSVTFLETGEIKTENSVDTPGGQHELYDGRRAVGLKAATGDIIAILEDRGKPAKNWARTAVRLHRETGKNVIGGAIDCLEPASKLNWAFYISDFGRYSRPFETGPREWVSDVNVTYSRKALDETRHLWEGGYHEAEVHWYLMGKGEELLLSNELIVHHSRAPLSLKTVLPERFDWARSFGEIRAAHMSAGKRALFVLASPLIPPVLWVRHGLVQTRKGNAMRYVGALPHLMVLTTAWALGEVRGYLSSRP